MATRVKGKRFYERRLELVYCAGTASKSFDPGFGQAFDYDPDALGGRWGIEE
jgi:hypothetical protein